MAGMSEPESSQTDPVYRADHVQLRRAQELDGLTAIFHRRSAATHLVGDPVPQILDILAEYPCTVDGLLARLAAAHDLVAGGDLRATLRDRLAELELSGLVFRT